MSNHSGPAKWWTVNRKEGREHIAKKGISQSGIVLNVDAGVTASYSGTGTTWNDLSGNNYHGTLTNGPTFNSSNGGNIVFDGIDDGIGITSTALLSVNAMTISSWNKSANYAHNGFMFEKTTNGNVNTQYSLFFNSNSTIYYRTYGLSSTDLTHGWSGQNTIINNKWNNVVATFDGTYKRIYINGILRATSGVLTGTVTQNTTGAAYIGVYGNFAGYRFNGSIAATVVYNRALSADEIKRNYNARKRRFDL